MPEEVRFRGSWAAPDGIRRRAVLRLPTSADPASAEAVADGGSRAPRFQGVGVGSPSQGHQAATEVGADRRQLAGVVDQSTGRPGRTGGRVNVAASCRGRSQR
jgi:hypothetical protein